VLSILAGVVLDGDITNEEKESLSRMEQANMMLAVCSRSYWPLIRKCKQTELGDLLATGGVLLPGSVHKIVTVSSARVPFTC
jgi:hypothetical protein